MTASGQLSSSIPPEIVAAAEWGWKIFPVVARDKKPMFKGWQESATSNLMQIEGWVRQYPQCNWGCATGKASGFFVLDVDGDPGLDSLIKLENEGKFLPDTRMHQTSRGLHLLFRCPVGIEIHNSTAKPADGLDIRGNGGYVVLPPSIHVSGARYSCTDDSVAISDSPQWLLDDIQSRKPLASSSVRAGSRVGVGHRTPYLFSLAGHLRGKGVERETIVDMLLVLNRTFQTPHTEEKVRKLAAEIERYGPGQLPPTRSPEIICLACVEAKPISWLFPGYLAHGMLTMLSGDPNTGKTFVALAIAAALSRGRVPVHRTPCDPVHTLYLSRENAAEYVIKPRFEALLGKAEFLHLLRGSKIEDDEGTTRFGVTLKDTAILEDALKVTGAKLMIIDPIQSYLGADVDAHRANETRPVMDGLIGLAEKYRVAVLVVRHLSKASGGRAIHRGLGSIDLTGAVRIELLAGHAPGDGKNRALVQVKNNVAPPADSLGYEIVGAEMEATLEWRGQSKLTADDLLAPDAEGEGRTEIADAVEFLQLQLAEGPKLQKKLEEESGFSERTLQRAAKRLGVKKTRDGEGGPWRWNLA